MGTGTLRQGPYSDFERLATYDSLPNFNRNPSAIMAARRDTVVDLKLIDGTVRQGLRLLKGTIYDIDFSQVVASNPSLDQSELWVFYLPSKLRVVPYV